MPKSPTDLHSYISYIQSFPRFGAELSLDRIQILLKAMGNPERQLKGIHVTGTNGKGSTCAMLFSILGEAGYRVGMYTSPHLVSYTERFQLKEPGRPASCMTEPEFAALLTQLRPHLDLMEGERSRIPTWFEILTIMAFMYFAQKKLDWVVVEVGMGGRFDATNVRDWEYKVITNVTLEHTKELGDTVTKIAGEKAGIIWPSAATDRAIRLVTACTGDALDVVRSRSRECEVGLEVVGIDLTASSNASDWSGSSFSFARGHDVITDLHLPLVGLYQQENVACAVGIATRMALNGDISLDAAQLRAGLARTNWPGRLEVVHSPVWPDQYGRLVLDGGHNADGVHQLVKTVRQLREEEKGTGKLHIIFGAKSDKKVDLMLRELDTIADDFIFTPIHELVADFDPADLRAVLGKGEVTASPAEALRLARQAVGPSDTTIICGSLYLVGEMKKVLGEQAPLSFDTMEFNADARRGKH
ncbi:hypothetical protein AUK40_01845 [Candidatus Wirthbacteria bacterium CG2_30_54_11]|uniref:tetrahydrofolate synthase n=1 Tax=Candidatus Wirthbacteria bacterium CG2_30_54_11 TaxID=1817892 RepID=A0A1J5ILZ7_9BACT|nr:MAG: hypothetical protein AUK40_01845 [Candidatus Wirthbacteria bacterium CG2_30_54_11]